MHIVMRRTIIFEMVSYSLCVAFFLVSMVSSLTQYQFEQVVIFGYYCALHISCLLLQHALQLKRGNGTHVMRLPLIIFSVLLLGTLLIAIFVCIQNSLQLYSFTTWNWFFTVHSVTLDTSLQLTLYSACAIVQCFKLKQYYTNGKKAKTTPIATCIAVVSWLSLSLILLHIICILCFPGKKFIAIVQVSYLMVQVVLLIPL